MNSARFLPIDISRDFQRCVEFLCDAFVCSYGNADEFERMGGAEAYRSGLRELVSAFPEGAVHVWREERIVGQIEMRIRPDSTLGVVNLFYLIPEERGGPLGAELQFYAIDVFRRHRASAARLSVSPSNIRAMAYYSKHGWRDLGPRPDRPYVHTMEFDVSRATQPGRK
jgi:ribosomal protein S18 acetylase RimI-like enzyme